MRGRARPSGSTTWVSGSEWQHGCRGVVRAPVAVKAVVCQCARPAASGAWSGGRHWQCLSWPHHPIAGCGVSVSITTPSLRCSPHTCSDQDTRVPPRVLDNVSVSVRTRGHVILLPTIKDSSLCVKLVSSQQSDNPLSIICPC